MPITKSAKKALRVARRRKRENEKRQRQLKEAIRSFRTKPSKSLLSRTVSALDKAADSKVIHKNRASRLKSRLGRLLAKKTA